MFNMTLSLPPHRDNRFREILSAIPRTSGQIDVDEWHQLLGELFSMELDLPGDQVLFIQIQEALIHV